MPLESIQVFTDASVVVAATLSPTGGSALIFKLANKDKFQLVLTKSVFLEAHLILKNKYQPRQLADLHRLLSVFKDSIKTTPTTKEQELFSSFIDDPKDYHVLAGAVKHQVDFLLTFDRRHFMTEKLQRANLSFTINTPGQFLEYFRSLQ